MRIMGARIKKNIIIQYRIIHSIVSLKFGAQCSVNNGRATHPLITQILCVCCLGDILDHFTVVTKQWKCQ